jgi:hypothetical protein
MQYAFLRRKAQAGHIPRDDCPDRRQYLMSSVAAAGMCTRPKPAANVSYRGAPSSDDHALTAPKAQPLRIRTARNVQVAIHCKNSLPAVAHRSSRFLAMYFVRFSEPHGV